jgi:hypothetical protein
MGLWIVKNQMAVLNRQLPVTAVQKRPHHVKITISLVSQTGQVAAFASGFE